ncbi:hybrid sensor histidine kinase/response regulator [Mesoterricola silvestris]|uniref:histidine kinase n=1 Tax=Mesoterricola silvestris TaxID=2927979 RepID=A0AA48GKV5_9BACT|nr:hybrid sensor histidine kinase/response regulator [Mesoterricola silvestris]BDU71305.1 hybrid sensor histidine kinase/response regulator [Mesoterricola silvestris]
METQETLLIIDDDAGLRRALRAFLEGIGLRVLDAPDGVRGLDLARREGPVMVLLDLTMPGMSGFEVCRELAALPGDHHPVVIVMSGLLGTTQRMKAFHAGAVDCLAKPVQYEELEVRVRTHLAIRRNTAALRESRDKLGKALHDSGAMNRNLLALNEKLQRSEAVKTRFLALMRNEIYNPLSDIMGLADGIADPSLPPGKAQELAARIKHEAFHLDCQIRNVFTAAEVEAGESSPFVTKVDVASVAEDVVASFAPMARTRGITLRMDLQGLGADFPTDADMLHHILANLLSNAVQHGAGVAELRATETEAGLVLEVQDAGPGIAGASLKAIFEPFRHADGPFKVARGQGLGLVVARALVDILDGRLDVESEPGQGSLFRVTLPRTTSLANPDAHAQDDNIIFFDEPQAF